MTKIVWDQSSERIYETGIDRGVLYIPNQFGIPWAGLTGLDDDYSEDATEPIYVDGIKQLDQDLIGNFKATLTAITYPDEFLPCEGILESNGMYIDGQVPTKFGLSFRSKVGNDTNGLDYGYKIHLLYNLTAVPDTKRYDTITSSETPLEFAWSITGTPMSAPGFRPTAHIFFDTRFAPEGFIITLETILYGGDTSNSRLPSITELIDLASGEATLQITDNGDGTWTAESTSGLITMVDETTFQINAANATYLTEDTYQISDTYA